MEPPKLLGIVLAIALLFHISLSAKQAVVSKKSKLCGNVECEEVLFKSRVKRVMGINNDPNFLNLAENAVISVVAVKFSDRPDIMEGKLNGEGPKGFFYAGAIDLSPFVEFLRTAIVDKKEMLMISQNPGDIGDNRIVGYVHSETDLVRDFNAKNAQVAAELGLPPPESLPIPDPPGSGHGHSHGGHGHSHGGHGHSHGGHGHSHEHSPPQNQPNPAQSVHDSPKTVESAQVPPKMADGAQSPPNPVETAQIPPKTVESVQIPPKTVESAQIPQNSVESAQIPPKTVESAQIPPKPVESVQIPPKPVESVQIPPKPVESVQIPPKPVESVQIPPKPVESAAESAQIPPKTADSVENPSGPAENNSKLDMDAEIEKMIQAEIERQNAQPDLVLQSLSSTPEHFADEAQILAQKPLSLSPEAQMLPNEPVTPPQDIQQDQERVTMPQHIPEPATTTPTPVEVPQPQIPPIPVENSQKNSAPDMIPEQSLPTIHAAPTPEPAQEAPPTTQPTPEAPPTFVAHDGLTTTPSPSPPIHQESPEQIQNAPETIGSAPEVTPPTLDVVNADSTPPEDPTPAAIPPPSSPEEEEYKKAEKERQSSTSAPYEDAQAHEFNEIYRGAPPSSARLFDIVKSSLGLGNVTDGTVLLYINLTFVFASLVFYIVARNLASGGDSDIFDRQAYFELVTKHKQLQLQLQSKNAEMQHLQANGVAQQQKQQQMHNYEPEVLALRQQATQLHSELQIALAQRQDFELHYNQLRELSEQKDLEITQLHELANDYKERLERSGNEQQEWARQLDTARAELNEQHGAEYGRQQELIQKQQEIEEAQMKLEKSTGEHRQLKLAIEKLESTKTSLQNEIRELKSENLVLQDTISQLEKDLEKEKSAGGSGGSGWSDFGDVDDIEEKKEEKMEKTPFSEEKSAEFQQKLEESAQKVANLKQKLEETEKELSKFKNLYQNSEKESRGSMEIEFKLRSAENEVHEAKKKIAELSQEKKELSDRLNEMLKNLNQTMQKSSENDKISSNLREEMFAKEKQLLEIDSTIRKKDDKIRELDSEFKRLQREYTKLETKSFHDVMKLKKELDDLKAQPMLGVGVSRDLFTALGPLGSSRPLGSGLGTGPASRELLSSPLEEQIWDEPDYALPQPANHQNQPMSQEEYFSSGSMTMPNSRRRSSRRSHLIGINGTESPSDLEKSLKSTKKETSTHRRRSRSQGRQMQYTHDPFSLHQYLPGSSDSSFLSQGFQPLSGRHSKSGHLSGGGQYSSGGSNGGRSPPPEMPLLSAIPPPGARKPMIKRPDSAHHHGK